MGENITLIAQIFPAEKDLPGGELEILARIGGKVCVLSYPNDPREWCDYIVTSEEDERRI